MADTGLTMTLTVEMGQLAELGSGPNNVNIFQLQTSSRHQQEDLNTVAAASSAVGRAIRSPAITAAASPAPVIL